MTTTAAPLPLHDLAPEAGDLLAECVAGLRQRPKLLPCKFFYDRRGSALFDAICELPEYYPTRTELAIMRAHVRDIVAQLGPRVLLIELGSGSSVKTRALLDHLHAPAGYVPMDISREHLWQAATRIAEAYPALPVMPVCADYLRPLELPPPARPMDARRVAYFPGSTIGNFHAPAARDFLGRIADLVGPGGGLLIGVDLAKPPDVLLPAYDDAQGVTAAFNRNLLHRINREAGGDFEVDRFAHRAVWNEPMSRVEMHLVAEAEQRVTLGGEPFDFAAGEAIRTECSYKRTLQGFADLAGDRFDVARVWTDARGWFSVQYLVAR